MLAGTAAAAAAASVQRWRNDRQRQSNPAEPQMEPSSPPVRSEGGPFLAGLRVVEMASIVAAPMVGRVLADWGAEVIKIEPPEGDFLRRMPPASLDQKPVPRETTASFDFFNLGKAGTQIDMGSSDQRQAILRLLESADVFLTNVRVEALKKAGLSFADLSSRFPRLIYAHLSGWGAEGEDAWRAGVDTGCFWAASGLAASMNDPRLAMSYPQGFGDIATGQGLLSGVLLALLERETSGLGQRVDASLLRGGLWCIGPTVITSGEAHAGLSFNETAQITNYAKHAPKRGAKGDDGLETAWWSEPFRCLGSEQFLWLEPVDDTPEMDNVLRSGTARALGLEEAELGEVLNSGVRGKVQEILRTKDAAEALQALQSQGVVCAKHVAFDEALSALFDVAEFGKKGKLTELFRAVGSTDLLGTDLVAAGDLPALPRNPIEFLEMRDQHGPRGKAPRKGEHTQAVLRRCAASPVASPSHSAKGGGARGKPLAGLTVVELSTGSLDISASATTAQLFEQGATVIKFALSDSASDTSYDHNRRVRDHYDVGKKHAGQTYEELAIYLGSADAVVTSVSMADLHKHGAALETWRSLYPRLVIVVLSPWGLYSSSNGADSAAAAAGMAHNCGAHGALWAASGLSAGFQPLKDAGPPTPPQYFPDLLASVFGFAAVSAGLLQQRWTGHGNIIDVSYLRCGLFLSSFCHCSYRFTLTREVAFGWASVPEEALYAVPGVFKTKDGQYFIQYDLRPDGVMRIAQVAGVGKATILRKILAGVPAFLADENRKKGASPIVLTRKLLIPLSMVLAEAFEKLTWHEASMRLKALDVWHNRIAMPYQMSEYTATSQGPDAGIFVHPAEEVGGESRISVRCPVFMSGSASRESSPAPLRSRL